MVDFKTGTPHLEEYVGPWKATADAPDLDEGEFDECASELSRYLRPFSPRNVPTRAYFQGDNVVGDRTEYLHFYDRSLLTSDLVRTIQSWLRGPALCLWRVIIVTGVGAADGALVVYPSIIRTSARFKDNLDAALEYIVPRMAMYTDRSGRMLTLSVSCIPQHIVQRAIRYGALVAPISFEWAYLQRFPRAGRAEIRASGTPQELMGLADEWRNPGCPPDLVDVGARDVLFGLARLRADLEILSAGLPFPMRPERRDLTPSGLLATPFFSPWNLPCDTSDVGALCEIVCDRELTWDHYRDACIILCKYPTDTADNTRRLAKRIMQACATGCVNDIISKTLFFRARRLCIVTGLLPYNYEHVVPTDIQEYAQSLLSEYSDASGFVREEQ